MAKQFTCRAEYAGTPCGSHELRAGLFQSAGIEVDEGGFVSMLDILDAGEIEIDQDGAFCGGCGESVNIRDEENFTK